MSLTLKDIKIILRDTGEVLNYAAFSFIVPTLISLAAREPWTNAAIYFASGLICFLLGRAARNVFYSNHETDIKHGFIAVTLVWIIYTAFASAPYYYIKGIPFIHSYYHVMSALTTTGLTPVSYDTLNYSLVLWQSILSWVGGLGIIVLAGAGILKLYGRTARLVSAEGRAERIRPSIKNTLKEMWKIYLLLTLFGIIILWFSGMSLYEAANYSMSAISTTGMDITSTGLTASHSPWIDLSLIIIMILGSIGFITHYAFIKKRDYNAYYKDLETRILLAIIVVAGGLTFLKMHLYYGGAFETVRNTLFHAVSSATGGGFSLESAKNIGLWDHFVKAVLVAAMFVGGCSGSTAGGIKLYRFWLLIKAVYWKLKEIFLPSGSVFSKKISGIFVKEEEIKEVLLFVLLYIIFIFAGVIILTAQGATTDNAVFEVVSAQSNVGIGTGITHAGMPVASEVMLIINMLVGRLEIIPVIALLGMLISKRR